MLVWYWLPWENISPVSPGILLAFSWTPETRAKTCVEEHLMFMCHMIERMAPAACQYMESHSCKWEMSSLVPHLWPHPWSKLPQGSGGFDENWPWPWAQYCEGCWGGHRDAQSLQGLCAGVAPPGSSKHHVCEAALGREPAACACHHHAAGGPQALNSKVFWLQTESYNPSFTSPSP